MLTFAPRLLDDELLYSYVGRWCRLSGFRGRQAFLDHAGLGDNHLLTPRGYGKQSVRTAFHQVADRRQVLFNHTTFPYYRPFLPKEVRSDIEWGTYAARKGARRVWINYSELTGFALQNCSQCAGEQRELHGVAYWTRSHNLPYVNTCHRHGIRLQFATDPVPRSSRGEFSRPGLADEEPQKANQNELEFARRSAALLRTGGTTELTANDIKQDWRAKIARWAGGSVRSRRDMRSVKLLLGRAFKDLGLHFTDEYVGSERFDKKVSELYSDIAYKSDPVFNVLLGLALTFEVGEVDLLRPQKFEPVRVSPQETHGSDGGTPAGARSIKDRRDSLFESHPNEPPERPIAGSVKHDFSPDLIRFGTREIAKLTGDKPTEGRFENPPQTRASTTLSLHPIEASI